MSNEMISFPRELSDDLAEFIAEKARVCGGGAYDIWEALCERFGQAGAKHQGEPVVYRCRHSENEPWFFSDKPGYWEWQPLYTRPAEQPAPVAVVLPEPSCRQRLAAEGKPYPRSSCAVCGQFSPKWRECDALIEVARLNPPPPGDSQ